MYPDLSYLLHDLFGSSPDNWTSIFKMFGLMLALALMAAGWVLKKELIRLEDEGKIFATKMMVKNAATSSMKDVILNGVIAMMFGAKIPYIISNFTDFQADPAAVIFSAKGNWILGALAGLVTAGYLYWESQKTKDAPAVQEVLVHPHEKTSDIVILAGVSGVAGAKIFSVLENMDAFYKDPIGTLFSGSGLTVYGGVILATIVVLWYIRKINIPPKYLIDIGGMGILVGYAVGRMGCQIAGDGDWGIVAAAQPEWWFLPEWLWAYEFPNNVAQSGGLIEGCSEEAYNAAYKPGISEEMRCQTACGVKYCHQLREGVYPTSVYEIVLWLGGFAVLWSLRRKIQITGVLFFMYMIYNGITRYFIEGIRVNDRYPLLGMNGSQAQYISILFVIIGVVGIVYLVMRHKSKPATD